MPDVFVAPVAPRAARADPEHTHVWPEELVRRTDQKIDAERLNVDRAMRREMHRVHPDASARGVCELGDAPHVIDGAEGVGGITDRHEPRALRQQLRQLVQIERAARPIDRDAPNHDAALLEIEPRADVRVVVEVAHDELVARTKRTPERAG